MIDPKLGYSPKTQELIDRMCRNVEREDFELDKKKAEECLLKTYDLFNLLRPKKIVWCHDIFDEKFKNIAWSARLARSARSARSAWSARSASSARSARSARLAGLAGSALDYDFDNFIFEFEYSENPNNEYPINEHDKKYLEYCELLIQAKEAGMGYILEYEDVLYCIPTPLVKIDNQNRFHSLSEPAIRWKKGKEFYFLHGVNFEKELWEKVVKQEISALEVLKLDNIEQRYVALKLLGAEKLLNELDAKLIDGKTERGNELYEIPNILEQPLKLLKYSCPSTDRVYVKFVPFEYTKADEAQAWSHNMTIHEYNNLTAES